MKYRHRKKQKKKIERKECGCNPYFYFLRKIPKKSDKFYYYEYNGKNYAKCKFCGARYELLKENV